VRVFDPAPTQGATYHRGVDGRGRGRRRGWHGESALLRLGVVSADDAEGVCRSARPPVDYRPHGTVLVGHDHDDLSRGTAASSC